MDPRETTHAAGARLKVIFENAYHDTAAKIRLCEICGSIGVDWVKTSTGYAPTGATMDDLRLMRKHSPPSTTWLKRIQPPKARGS